MTIRHPRLLWAAVLPVVLAELAATGLVFRHDMSAPYRAYYIDKTTDCWRHVTTGDYTLGTTLSFVSSKQPLFFPNKICGWFYPTDSGTWSYGRYSLLRFVFTPAGGPLQLRLSAGAMVSPVAPEQSVAVSANGRHLALLTFDRLAADDKQIEIPAEIADSGRIELRFDYQNARPGTELGPNEDPHLRAIRMVTLTLDKG